MKKLSKLLALLLALAMMFSLAACNSGDKAGGKSASIVGEWDCEMNISDAMKKKMAESTGSDALAPDAKLRMNIKFDFKDNGKLEMSLKINEDDFKKYMEALCDNMMDYLYDTLEAQGLSKDMADALISSQYGMSMAEYVKENMETAMDGAIGQINQSKSGYYKLDKEAGLIYTADTEAGLEEKKDAYEYKLDGSKLTLVNVLKDGEVSENSLAAYGLELPWVFEKQ